MPRASLGLVMRAASAGSENASSALPVGIACSGRNQAGRLVESGSVVDVMDRPTEDYTRQLQQP